MRKAAGSWEDQSWTMTYRGSLAGILEGPVSAEGPGDIGDTSYMSTWERRCSGWEAGCAISDGRWLCSLTQTTTAPVARTRGPQTFWMVRLARGLWGSSDNTHTVSTTFCNLRPSEHRTNVN